MAEIVSSFEVWIKRFLAGLDRDLKTLYSMLFLPSFIQEPEGPVQEAAEAEERREETKPEGDPLAPKPIVRTPEEEARQKAKMEELRQRQKETGSDEAKAEYEANKEEIQRTEGTHQRHQANIKAPLYRR